LLLEGQQHHGRLAITVLASGVTSQQAALTIVTPR
jgi:hypothetical protein